MTESYDRTPYGLALDRAVDLYLAPNKRLHDGGVGAKVRTSTSAVNNGSTSNVPFVIGRVSTLAVNESRSGVNSSVSYPLR